MPENADPGSASPALAPAQLAAALAARIGGPHCDADTVGAAETAAEAIRYLNHAAPRGGVTEPATVSTAAAALAAAAYRLPQLLAQLAEWLAAETAVGRIADDHHRPAWQLADATHILLWEATEHADHLASALSAAANITATLHAIDGPAAPAA
jgi:hypothetical protein